MKIKINSELPITMLEDYNESLNTFDFVLFHLYISDPNYKNYFNSLRESHPERTMIFDNSAYEFFIKGEKLDMDKYVDAIIELNPDYYILPDVLMDKEQTITNVLNFRETHQKMIEDYFKDLDQGMPQSIAVVQGNSIEEMKTCLNFYGRLGVENIAIPFHNSFFKEAYEWCDGDIAWALSSNGYTKFTEDVRYSAGRAMWVKENLDTLKEFKKVHLLGSHCPAEKAFYESLDISNLTMDTGYPVKCAIEGMELGKENKKPNIIIDDFMNEELDEDIKNLIVHNVNKFKNYTNE